MSVSATSRIVSVVSDVKPQIGQHRSVNTTGRQEGQLGHAARLYSKNQCSRNKYTRGGLGGVKVLSPASEVYHSFATYYNIVYSIL
jgi:hypothetical protein